MCGIVFAIASVPVERFVRRAHARQHYRGPDGEGLFFQNVNDAYLGFAHQRLSILDLSARGTQPMMSASGKSRIIFNGEIYNYRELVHKFKLPKLKTETDTEVAIELIEKIGITAASNEFNGMWSIIVYNTETNRIYISRDRFGKKPLYYAHLNEGVYFASEMHSLLFHRSIKREVNPIVAAKYLSQSIMNANDLSWINGINVFPASSCAEIDVLRPEKGLFAIHKFWSPDLYGIPDNSRCVDDDIHQLKWLLDDAVKLRLHADVPVGIALSGGLDSSIIATIASQQQGDSDQHVKLFSVVNPGDVNDESQFINEMSNYLNLSVDKFVLKPGSDHSLYNLVRTCIQHNDGPIMSFSNVLFYKLMELASISDIKVILTGQGADEAFCGYRKYPMLEIKRLIQSRDWLTACRFGADVLLKGTILADFKLSEAKRYFGRDNRSILGTVARNAYYPEILAEVDSLASRQWKDISYFSVPYLCHYEDRMSMAWSREVRAPFLDYRVVEAGLRVPLNLKMKDGWTKYPLRRAYSNELPDSIAWRRDKKGFSNPQDEWLRVNLRNYIVELMENPTACVYENGLVDKSSYLKLLHSYLNGNDSIWFRDVFAPFSLELWILSLNEIEYV